MMQTKYIIEITNPHRTICPTYYYAGQTKVGCRVLDYHKTSAKRYVYFEEADRDMRILAATHEDKSDQFKVITVRCRT